MKWILKLIDGFSFMVSFNGGRDHAWNDCLARVVTDTTAPPKPGVVKAGKGCRTQLFSVRLDIQLRHPAKQVYAINAPGRPRLWSRVDDPYVPNLQHGFQQRYSAFCKHSTMVKLADLHLIKVLRAIQRRKLSAARSKLTIAVTSTLNIDSSKLNKETEYAGRA